MIHDITALIINSAFQILILLSTWVAVYVDTKKFGIELFVDDRLISYSSTTYYWTPKDRNYLGIVLTSLCLIAHTLSFWFLLLKNKQQYELELIRGKGISREVNRYNALLFIINALAIMIHLTLTSLFYDGIQSFIPFWIVEAFSILSQLYFILIDVSDHGLFFGYFKGYIPNEVSSFINEFSPPLCAFSTILSLWFHPSENNVAYLTGMLGVCLIFSHLCLLYSPIIKKPAWRFILGTWFVLHIVAASAQKKGFWYGHLLGLLTYVTITPLFYFKKMRFSGRLWWIRIAPFLLMISISIAVFSQTRFYYILIIFIPSLVIYSSTFLVSLWTELVIKLNDILGSRIRIENKLWKDWFDVIYKTAFTLCITLIVIIASAIAKSSKVDTIILHGLSFVFIYLGGTLCQLLHSKFKRIEGVPDVQ